MDTNSLVKLIAEWIRTTGLTILIIFIVALVLGKVLRGTVNRSLLALGRKREHDGEFVKRRETLSSILHWFINILVFVIALIMILDEVGVPVGPILTAAGVLGLAVGFGAQSLVKDLISGFFIFLEDQIRVGDVVDIAGKAGLVERVNLKMTVLRDLAGNVHFVPNGEITTVTNMTKGYSRYVFDIGVAYREDTDEVMEIMRSVDEGMRSDPDYSDDILEPLEILGLDKFGDSALVIKARTTTKPIKQWRIAREFNRRLKKAFDENNIEIPFPHVTLYMGEDKQGQAPPMHVVMENQERENREKSG